MKKPGEIVKLICMIVSFNLHCAVSLAAANQTGDQTNQVYLQGYQDGFIYTAQQSGKGCKNRLSQAAISRLDQSVRNTLQPQGDSPETGDAASTGDGDAQLADYNAGKMQGMSDALGAPNDGTDLCASGD